MKALVVGVEDQPTQWHDVKLRDNGTWPREIEVPVSWRPEHWSRDATGFVYQVVYTATRFRWINADGSDIAYLWVYVTGSVRRMRTVERYLHIRNHVYALIQEGWDS